MDKVPYHNINPCWLFGSISNVTFAQLTLHTYISSVQTKRVIA